MSKPRTTGSAARRPPINQRRIGHLCRRYRILELVLFRGFMLRRNHVGVLFSAEPEAIGFDEYFDLLARLRHIFARPVDLVRRQTVERDTNPIRRRAILDGAKIIYRRRRSAR